MQDDAQIVHAIHRGEGHGVVVRGKNHGVPSSDDAKIPQ